MAKHHIPLKLDRTALSIGSLSDTSEERTYWLTQTPRERLKQIEILRMLSVITVIHEPRRFRTPSVKISNPKKMPSAICRWR